MLRHSVGRRAVAAPLALVLALGRGPAALAAGPPVALSAEPGVDAAVARRVRDVIGSRRAIREDLALPPAGGISADQAVMAERAASIRLALERAHRAETEASWDACVHEAADALPAAIEVLSKVNDLALLRELHVQIGACLTLAGSPASARPHFISAALLDESEPKIGLHREEAERLQTEALADVRSRVRGPVRIETTPPGAEVWIDGRKIPGVTPLSAEVRVGDHYVTTRRFRFEPRTERTVLQPPGVARSVLDPASRGTLRDQLAAIGAGAVPSPPPEELTLARAVWSRAEQVVDVAALPAAPGSYRVRVLDALTGEVLNAAKTSRGDDEDAVRRAVCEALGETCEVKPRGVPWYVWPITGAAVVSAVVSAVVIVNANRDYRYCFACK
jgi:hypothetical protein